MKPCCIAISATDPTCGAGCHLDTRLLTHHDLYPISVITGITLQTIDSFEEFFSVSPELFRKQLENVIINYKANVIKIGMLGDICADILVELLEQGTLKHKIILDTILASSSGFMVVDPSKLSKLFKYTELVTPNIPEMELFLGRKIEFKDDMIYAVKEFTSKYMTKGVLLKSGHLKESDFTDIYFDGQDVFEFPAAEIYKGADIHGTGCYLSTAISAYLTKGCDILSSISFAKKDILNAMKLACSIGESKRKVFVKI